MRSVGYNMSRKMAIGKKRPAAAIYHSVEDSSSDEDYQTIGRQFNNENILQGTLFHNNGSETFSSQEHIKNVRRRGRAPSKRPCLNRNALMARENRQRKKEYVEKIENLLKQFQMENKKLKEMTIKQANVIKKLTTEVSYYKNVLNNRNIVPLLQCINESLQRMHCDSKSSKPMTDDATKSVPLNIIQQQCTSYLCKDPLSPNEFKNSQDEAFLNKTKKVFIARKSLPLDHDYHDYLQLKQENTNSSEENISTDETSKGSPMSNSNLCKSFEHNGYQDENFDNPNFSETDLSQLSFNIDAFDNFDQLDEASPLDFNTEPTDLFPDDSLLNSTNDNPLINHLELDEKVEPDAFNNGNNGENSWNNNADNSQNRISDAGVCLHINSHKVSLEYCPSCHLNSMKSDLQANS